LENKPTQRKGSHRHRENVWAVLFVLKRREIYGKEILLAETESRLVFG
jgi:hypothetical protein